MKRMILFGIVVVCVGMGILTPVTASAQEDIVAEVESLVTEIETYMDQQNTDPVLAARTKDEPTKVSPSHVDDEPVPVTKKTAAVNKDSSPKAVPQDVKKATAMEKSPVDPLDKDLRKRKIEDLVDGLVINEMYYDAKKIKLPPNETRKKTDEETVARTLTSKQIIQNLLKSEYKDVKIDLAFADTNLDDILMTIGSAGGLNIVLDPQLRDNTFDLTLADVNIEEALLLIADAYNLGFKQIGGSLFVTTREKLRNENMTSKVIRLRNLSVAEAKNMLDDMAQTINVSEEINSLIVRGQPEEILKVEEIVKQIDLPQPQVVLEAKIIEVNKDALKELGVDWSDQILLSYQEAGRPVDFADPETGDNHSFRLNSISRNALQFDMTIKMLENQNKAKILSNPRITTLNDKEAEIFVGDRLPYTVTTVTGGVATTDVRFEEPGIRLTITPSIIDEEFVVIKVEPEVSFIFAFRGPNDNFPHTKQRQAVAYVRVKNNQPFVLGGLLTQEDKRNLFKVPMLGSLPLLGNLFSYEKHTVEDTELIITIVPRIVYENI